MTFREMIEQQQRRLDFHVASNLHKAGSIGGVELVELGKPMIRILITPCVGSTAWRATRFDEVGAWGHFEFPTRESAIRAYSGEAFSDHVKGPAYSSVGQYFVTRTFNPRKSHDCTRPDPRVANDPVAA